MGPHGLCVGATGSGKSELLRTIALGMMARNSPDVLNLLLVDFKGGATFLDYANARHVAAVITNLADDAPLVDRMRAALAGEMNRRQEALRTAGCDQHARRSAAALPALPTLFVIVDEFSELLSQQPDFADTFVAIGRLGRSLGIHLLLASQRLDEGRLRGLDAHLSYRLCLKTLSEAESRAVMGDLDAYHLPADPGAGYLRVGAGEPIRFQAALVSGPLRPDTAPRPPAMVRVFGTRVTGWPATGWLPPLGRPPELCTLLGGAADLTVPVGLVDRPFEQCRTPLIVDLSGAAGNVAVVGAPRSGKSTALRTLITALAATHDPARVQFYCLDFGGGALSSLHTLPHVGAVAGRAEPRRVGRIVAECEAVVRRREAFFGEHAIASIADYRQRRPGSDPFGDVFLVIDGWAVLRRDFETLEASIIALAGQGLSFGVHLVLSASRWADIRPALRDQIGTRIELRLGDPADSEIDRRAAAHVPRDSPGRGLSHPARVDLDAVRRGSGDEFAGRPLLGLQERQLQPVAIDFARESHLLILGANGCGKTAALRTLCRELVRTNTAAQAQLVIVDFRRALLGIVESEQLHGYAMSPAALTALLPGLLDLLSGRMPPPDASQAQLRAGSWWSGPDVYVVVDDYDLVASPSGNLLAPLVGFLPYASELGLHLIIARRSGGAERAMFEPLLAGLRDLGCMSLTMSEAAPFAAAPPADHPGRRRRTRPGGLEPTVSPHRAVVETGPATIRRLCCGTRMPADREVIEAALDAIDDPVALVGERPVAVEALWKTALRSACCACDGAVVVYPSWWPPARVRTVRSWLLARASRAAPEGTVVVEPCRREPGAGGRADRPDLGAAELGPLIADALRGRIRAEMVHINDIRLARLACSASDGDDARPGPCPARPWSKGGWRCRCPTIGRRNGWSADRVRRGCRSPRRRIPKWPCTSPSRRSSVRRSATPRGG